MKFIYSLFIAMLFSNAGIAQDKITAAQYPWLAKSGKFGYCDSAGKVVIQPQFDYGEPFKNGYAVVSKNGLEGVINRSGKVIIPLKYPTVRLYNSGLFTLAIYKKEYIARARFWKWRVMPDWNVLSTSYKGPFLSTRVPRAVWTIKSLSDGKVLYNTNRTEESLERSQYWRKDWLPERNVPRDIKISAKGKALKIADQLFLLNAQNKLKKIADNVLELIDETSVLAFKKEQYFKMNIKGGIQDKENFTMVDSIIVTANPAKSIYIRQQNPGMYPFRTIADFIFKSSNGKTYLFPDLRKSSHPIFRITKEAKRQFLLQK
ncbi:WG repeat-containing protein [Pedobacter sp. NJ-S-72]